MNTTLTARWNELPTLSTLGGHGLGLSDRGLRAYQYLAIRDREATEAIVRTARRLRRDLEPILVRQAESEWQAFERAAAHEAIGRERFWDQSEAERDAALHRILEMTRRWNAEADRR
jgi:hypothetical protein